MRLLREVRISILYISIFVFLPVIFMKTKGFEFGNYTFNELNVVILIFVTFIWFASLPLSIYFITRSANYFNMLRNERLIEWTYDRSFWLQFVYKEAIFRFKNDLYFYMKLGLKVSIISLIAFGINILINNKTEMLTVLLIMVGVIFTFMISWCFCRNIIFVIENIIFSNGQVIGTRDGLSFNGEYHYWHNKSTHKLLGVGIDDKLIYIDYLVSKKDNEVRRIRIPIPNDRFDEAERYVRIL